ncbi:uncharacterized protein LOC123506791 isoform X1 [Portunus trituberculatus]|uniref:uncharacterized protein LOC123506791 isoform X1 n=1 Tax=Portunus trituberculatus TaxID=210409 RepID=UPI001E1D0298|nr:uncharacterized protein LOC123506791 isoform X1 [Portunus trituberculatus]
MSAVVNGHREEGEAGAEGGSGASGFPRGRPHHGHILPMLSFSASTPTEDEDPLENDPVLAIDSPLWEQPEVEVVVTEPTSYHHHNHDPSSPPHHHRHHHQDDERLPLIPQERSVLIIDSGRSSDEDDEVNERMPLLSDSGGGGGGGGGGGCGVGLSLPLNLSRRASSQVGLPMANGDPGGDMSSTIASFLRIRADPSHSQVREKEGGAEEAAGLREVAGRLVTEVLARAKEQAATTTTSSKQMTPDERLMEMVRGFVSDIMARAKAEAYDSMCHIQNNNNNLVMGKEEAARSGTVGGRDKRHDGAHGLASPSSASGGRTYRRGGPWYVQMGRVFSSFLTRICPCRCPTKP